MLKTITRKFKLFFVGIRRSSLELVKSAGLLPLCNFIFMSPLKTYIDEEILDRRDQSRITYLASEFIITILLRFLEGSIRLFQHRCPGNNNFFKKIFQSGRVPHFTTLIYFLKKNKEDAHRALERVMFRFSIWVLTKEIQRKNLKTITIDVDATAGSIYGKQEGAKRGYNPEKRNQPCFQLQVWTIRETKTLLRLELRNGSTHCSSGILEDLRILIPRLKTLGVKIRFIADSGYESYEVLDYLESMAVGFVIAQKQRKTVKNAGKWAKNKQKSLKYDSTLKERRLETQRGIYRQIFVQVEKIYDEDGQIYFNEFLADEFTNVFVSNMAYKAETIYGMYRNHAQVETIIGELKSDLGAVKSRCHDFSVNQGIVQLCGIAYNMKVLYARSILQSSDEIPNLRRLREEELNIPGYFSNHSGKLVFNVQSESFERFLKIANLVNLNRFAA